jgi:predicted transglutaminase-like cysteine proteinase
MRALKVVGAIAGVAMLAGTSISEAAFFSYPRMLGVERNQIGFAEPVLAPMQHVRFCLNYPDDCAVHGVDFRKRHIVLTVDRWDALNAVNRAVNRYIAPQPDFSPPALAEWRILPAAGDCADYAVTKRHMLLALGWPSRSLLLSEVVVPSGEHHLVLVVQTKGLDLVLDNLSENIRPLRTIIHQYRWVRMETPFNPKFWSTVTLPRPVHTATLADLHSVADVP